MIASASGPSARIAARSITDPPDGRGRERRVTTLYVSNEFGAVESIVERLVLVRGGIVFDGPPRTLPSKWHDPSHAHARL